MNKDSDMLSFVEFIENIAGEEWNDAVRITANVKSPIETRMRAEWIDILDCVKNKPITN